MNPIINILFFILVIQYSISEASLIDQLTQTEINNRVQVNGAMGGGITLTSNSSIGSGAFAFVLAGETQDCTPVAIKVMSKHTVFYSREYNCYEKMDATKNKICEKYGIPFIYHSDNLLQHKTLAMTMLDTDLLSLHKKLGAFSKDSILILFRDMVRTLKFMHSKGIINQDIKPDNIMTKGANVFLCDFNQSDEKDEQKKPHAGSRLFRSIALHMGESPAEYDDIQSLFYSMLLMADVELPWMKIKSEHEILKHKLRLDEVKNLCNQLKYAELIKPFAEFYVEAIESMHKKRLPNYDYLYNMFDEALYSGRNRSERIVFEWLTERQKAAAMIEEFPSIESIVFH